MSITKAHDQTRVCSVSQCRDAARAGGMCQRHYSQTWYRNNREHVFDNVKRWRSSNPSKVRAYKEKWCKENAEYRERYALEHRAEAVERATRWNQDHPEAAREHGKNYRDNHREAERAKTQRRRALKASLVAEKILDSTVFERDGWICKLCSRPVDRELPWPHPLSKSIDHIIPITIPGSSHTLDNLQLAHLACNSRKGNRYVETI